MSETKQKILSVAEKLFFSQGIANVRLQQIADDAGISVGNLAYHYRNKEAIVQAVYDNMFEQFSGILSSYLQTPDLSDFDRLFATCYDFFTANAYYLNNIWEINRYYPDIRKRWEVVNTKMIAQIKKRLEFNTGRGMFSTRLRPEAVDALAQNLWLSITFWMPQQMLLGKKTSLAQYRRALWSQLTPLLSKEGQAEYDSILSGI